MRKITRKGKITRKRKITRKGLVRQADTLFSEVVRAQSELIYKNCPFCRVSQIEECFHFFSRVNYSTRWDFENAIGSCRGCNLINEYRPHKFCRWYKDRYGIPQWDALEKRHYQISKLSNSDLKAICEYIRKRKKLLEHNK